jgi:hypothetical protein
MSQSVESLLRDFLRYKSLSDDASGRAGEIKTSLIEIIERLGYTDDRGHQWFDLEEEVEGYYSLQRQKRISKALDQQTAEEILRERGIHDECIKMVPSLDEDAIMAALYEGTLSDEDIDRMFPAKVTYAFVPSKK